jgi:CubicO group peptidase (beta-lactamase class C family)
VVALSCAFAAAPAHAAATCEEPGRTWQRVAPADAGMDAERLQDALDYGTSQLAFAVRVYRHGCLVGEDRLAGLNRESQYESYSMAKSVTAMVFGRAMTLGLVSPDDPVGSLVPEADGPHGRITLRDLLTMTSGLRWNGFRDFNIFTMPDRVRDALTLEPVREPGTYFEYAQSAVSLLAEAVGRAAGMDFERFAQLELMGRLGIRDEAWWWARDKREQVMGFYGVNMRPDDYGRLGELLRRGGVWRGERLLSQEFMRRALEPTPTNGCYGWLIWLNSGAPCIGARVTERPVDEGRSISYLPADMYRFSGLFGQLVAVFPSQGIVVARVGEDPGALSRAGEGGWEGELYRRVLAAVTDQSIDPPGEPVRVDPDRSNADAGFGDSLAEPDQYSRGVAQEPLPPAGPERARAPQIDLTTRRVSRRGVVAIRLACPPLWPDRAGRRCTGEATLEGAAAPVSYDVGAGEVGVLRFRLRTGSVGRELQVVAVNGDAAGGVPASRSVMVRPARR